MNKAKQGRAKQSKAEQSRIKEQLEIESGNEQKSSGAFRSLADQVLGGRRSKIDQKIDQKNNQNST